MGTHPPADATTSLARSSIASFGADLARRLAPGTGGNVAFSPYSVATALAMSYPGARGRTAAEMAAVLHVGSDPEAVARAFGDLETDLARRQGDGVTLEGADALWGQHDTAFRPPFVTLLQQHFGAALQLVDYRADAEGARKTINAWVADHTNGRIAELLPHGFLDASTRLVLTDAVYLLAKWASPFARTDSSPAPFFAPGRQVQARTMSEVATLPYASGAGYQAVELPYAGGELAADVVLPEADGLRSLSEHLDTRLPGILERLAPTQLQLRLPSFTVTSRFELAPILEALGMRLAFSDRADFSAMAADQPLEVSAVAHQAYVKVDEDGTEAAAATGVGVQTTAKLVWKGKTMTVDRPFLLVVRDRTTGTLLFVAQIQDPTVGP